MRAIIQSLMVCWLVNSCSGCGDSFGPTGTIEGKLTMDDKPMAAGYAVSFMQMQSGFLAFGTTDAQGNFTVNSWNKGNMPIGKYDVMVAPPGGENVEDTAASAEDRFEQQQVSGKLRSSIPLRYRQTTTSGISFEVKEGKNVCNVELKSK